MERKQTRLVPKTAQDVVEKMQRRMENILKPAQESAREKWDAMQMRFQRAVTRTT